MRCGGMRDSIVRLVAAEEPQESIFARALAEAMPRLERRDFSDDSGGYTMVTAGSFAELEQAIRRVVRDEIDKHLAVRKDGLIECRVKDPGTRAA